MHVGEDFVHLLTGLRSVAEAVWYYGLGEGDRLGHAISLGVDVRDWVRRAGRVPVSVEDRLLDLSWEWAWCARHAVGLAERRRVLIESEVSRLSKALFGKMALVQEMVELMDDCHDPLRLAEVGFPGRWRYFNAQPPDHLVRRWRYLTDPGIFARGREIEWIDPTGEADALVDLQAGIRHVIASRGITVEVNPSSNLLIGDMGDLVAHPLWRLSPVRATGEAPPVAICVGSDDPLTFATDIRQEYQLIYDALLAAGLGEEESRSWIERVRRNGLDARFTLGVC
jgi:hypothetical protein